MIPVFEQAKTVPAVDRAAIVIVHEVPRFDLKVLIWRVITARQIIGSAYFSGNKFQELYDIDSGAPLRSDDGTHTYI
jgi:hypothetical protein